MNKHAKAQASPDAQPLYSPDIEKPTAAWPAATSQGTVQGTVEEQLDALRRRIAALDSEIDAIGTSPGAERIATTKGFIEDKRAEIQRLKTSLDKIEQSLVAG
ncbi:MAG TPA: hypothetical protein VD840_14795 [Sinorhizobium sp.]|nr:hypothetical protein [Sinorhizobium sp.]